MNEVSFSPRQERPLSVLMVDSHAEVERGGAVQCASLALALARKGHRVTCVFDGPTDRPLAGEAFASLRGAGVELQRAPLGSPLAMLRFRRQLADLQPDIVHTHKNRALFFVYFATLGRPPHPWITNRGTVYPLSRNPVAHYVHRRHVQAMIAVSAAVGEALVEDGIDPDKVRVVLGSFDPDRFDPEIDGRPLRRTWGVADDHTVVGMVASLNTPKKGHPVFLEAAARLAGRYPDTRFVLVGEGDPAPLRGEADRLGIGGRVIFAGFSERVPEALAAMDVFVCASLRGEGLTGSVREAMAMARPVVSSDVAGNRELVIDGETGLLVPPGAPEALAEATASLLEDPERARALGHQGRQKVLGCCTQAIRTERVEGIYRECLAGSSRPGVEVEHSR